MRIPESNNHNTHKPELTPDEYRLHYKGHGQLESTRAGSSLIHVISHELAHIAEFKNQAIRDKVDIRNVEMQIHFEYRDGKLVATGGKTRVTTASQENSESSNNPYEEMLAQFTYQNPEQIVAKTEEAILRDRLDKIQLELKTILAKAFYTDSKHVTIDGLKEDKRQANFKEIRNRLQTELEMLRQREQFERSKLILLEIVELQRSLKKGFLDPSKFTVSIEPEKHLDLIA
jgi:hypothetical protein